MIFVDPCKEYAGIKKRTLEGSIVQCGQTYMFLALLFAPFPWFDHYQFQLISTPATKMLVTKPNYSLLFRK
jgi:hypothetical protein